MSRTLINDEFFDDFEGKHLSVGPNSFFFDPNQTDWFQPPNQEQTDSIDPNFGRCLGSGAMLGVFVPGPRNLN
jgi:hypothetical protein